MQRRVYRDLGMWLLCKFFWVGAVFAAEGFPPFPISDADWRTDFNRHTVPLHEIQSGGPPRDGIPPLDTPRFVPFAAADTWLQERESVVTVQRHGVAKAYPLQILIWHEIVNDIFGDEPDEKACGYAETFTSLACQAPDSSGSSRNTRARSRGRSLQP